MKAKKKVLKLQIKQTKQTKITPKNNRFGRRLEVRRTKSGGSM